MKRLPTLSLIALSATALASVGISQVIVNDTWIDGERNNPYDTDTLYSESGTDSDSDGDIESAWFLGGSGTLDPVGAGGPLRLDQTTTSSASVTTYFTEEGSELTLANANDQLKLTWTFQVSGVVQDNTSQGFRIALVDSPSGSRVTGESSPGSATYAGYSMFMNMNSNTFTHSKPFQLMERTDPGTSSALLSSSGSWTGLDDGTGASGNAAYFPGIDYTFEMTLTRTVSDELAVVANMTGTGLNGTGSMMASATAAPNGGSWSFDTFEFRPDGYDRAWELIDTSLFKVELLNVPEPSTLALLGLGGLGLLLRRRK